MVNVCLVKGIIFNGIVNCESIVIIIVNFVVKIKECNDVLFIRSFIFYC